MNRTEFYDLEIGDMVVVTIQGKNKGKLGIVREIIREGLPSDGAYIEPFQCEFEYANASTLKSKCKDGLHHYNHRAINYRVAKAEPLKSNVYLYSLRMGELKVYEGEVRKTVNLDGIFITETGNIACSSEPRDVYNGVVWLPEKHDNLAKSILIQYEEAEIAILKEKIEYHSNIIRNLKGEIK
jgi:ribosomal protein L24